MARIVFQPGRWRDMVDAIQDRANTRKLSAEFIIELYEKIHHESIRMQLSIIETKDKEIKK